MKKYTFEDIRNQGLLLYEYVRGSVAYGTNTPQSDEDHGGVYLEPIDQVLGLGLDFQDEISDEKHDTTWYSLKKYLTLLMSSNPNILESLFVDDRFVIYEHPIITELKKHRQEFVTKDCFNSFIGYAIAQIKRARGYNKMCVQPITERKMPIDFCYTTYKQGSACITEWLAARGLEQKYCGLVSLNNMPDCYGVYYDFGAHNMDKYGGKFEEFLADVNYCVFVSTAEYGGVDSDVYEFVLAKWFEDNQTPIGYRGIVKGDGTADDVRCSSIPKNKKPICTMSYNKDGFTQHCMKYHQYQEWVQKRNQVRYESNLGHMFDSKNMSHCFRLLNMGIEIAQTGKVQIYRKGIDSDFLLDIRNHKYEYEYLIKELENKKEALDKAISESTLPEHIDPEMVNNLLLDIRYNHQIYTDDNPYVKKLVNNYYDVKTEINAK